MGILHVVPVNDIYFVFDEYEYIGILSFWAVLDNGLSYPIVASAAIHDTKAQIENGTQAAYHWSQMGYILTDRADDVPQNVKDLVDRLYCL